MKAKSIKGNSPEEIRSALQQSMADGIKPTVAILFISIKQDRKAVCEILHDQGIDILGATSCGEFINGYQDVGSVVILLLDLSRDAYTILFSAIGDKSVNEAGAELARRALEKFRKPAFILCSTGVSTKGKLLDGEALVRSIAKLAGPQVNIYGGMAGDDRTFTGTYVFCYEKETDEGIAALTKEGEGAEFIIQLPVI